MQYRKLGTSDLNCSVIGLGTWPMSGNAYGRVDDRQSIAAILASIEAGVNFIDTAPAYGNGHAESVLGEALKSVAREKVIIATKFGNRFDEDGRYIRDASAKCVREGIEASLRRLGTDYIDLWQCHWPDPSTPIEETMEEVARHVESGKVRYVGVSNFNGALMDEARKYVPIVSLQPPYSLLDRGFEGEIQDYCLKNNIGVLFHGPVGTGKSFFACAIANELLQKHVPTTITSFPRLLNLLQDSNNRQWLLDCLGNYKLVVIDDLGVERETSYAAEQIFAVIDARSRAKLPTIITTNLTKQEMENQPSMQYRRIFDRVREMCPAVVLIDGQSRRIQNAHQRRELARELLI